MTLEEKYKKEKDISLQFLLDSSLKKLDTSCHRRHFYFNYFIKQLLWNPPLEEIWPSLKNVGAQGSLSYWHSQPRFRIQPRRGVVEPILAWISKHRRLSKDYEYLTDPKFYLSQSISV